MAEITWKIQVLIARRLIKCCTGLLSVLVKTESMLLCVIGPEKDSTACWSVLKGHASFTKISPSHHQYKPSTCNNTDLVIQPSLTVSHSIAHYSFTLLDHFWRMDSPADHSARWSLWGQMGLRLTNIYKRWQVESLRCSSAALSNLQPTTNWQERSKLRILP